MAMGRLAALQSGKRSLREMGDNEFVDHLYGTVLRRKPDVAGRLHWLALLKMGRDRLDVLDAFVNGPEFQVQRAAMRFAPPGHFYSPYPSAAAIAAHHDFDFSRGPLPAIDFREAEQMALLEKLAQHYGRLPFADAPGPEARYGYVNTAFSYGDGATLFCMIQHLRPRRIIEVGSGHSSCAMLDAIDRMGQPAQVTFIEPFPELLKGLLRPGDLERHALLERPVQDCPLSMFEALEANDILFIDSSHVSKLASDVNYLMFEVLPVLRPGVWVHIHDVLHPFEYPPSWYDEGRAWNETYLVRAFLQYNTAWRMEYFSTFMTGRHEEWYRTHMPVALRIRPGGIWISRAP